MNLPSKWGWGRIVAYAAVGLLVAHLLSSFQWGASSQADAATTQASQLALKLGNGVRVRVAAFNEREASWARLALSYRYQADSLRARTPVQDTGTVVPELGVDTLMRRVRTWQTIADAERASATACLAALSPCDSSKQVLQTRVTLLEGQLGQQVHVGACRIGFIRWCPPKGLVILTTVVACVTTGAAVSDKAWTPAMVGAGTCGIGAYWLDHW